MSSWSGSGSNPHQRPRESMPDFPPLSPPSTLPPLRTLNSPRSRDAAAPRSPPRYHWSSSTAARRAERIRNLDDRLASRGDGERYPDYGGRWSMRRFPRMHAQAADGRGSNIDELDRSLDEANTNLRALLDLTQSALTTIPQPLRSHDFPDDNRRNKRRKLDADRLGSSGVKPFRYGRYGQVEPGQLRMEIVSCDGGMFSNQSSYAAENILKDDNSVYCTKGNRCNIVLQHQGGSVFTLQELVIKAPCATNFSHPVREGMIFVTMHQDDMLSRTAQYQIQYAPSSRQRSRNADGDNALVLEREPRHIVSIQHHVDGTTSTRTRRSYVYRPDDDESRLPEMPEEFNRETSDFRVTTECSDEEDDDDDGYGGSRFHHTPNRIGSLPFENVDSDADDIVMPFSPQDTSDDLLLHHSRRHNIIHRQRDEDDEHTPSFSLSEAMDAHANATQEAVRAVGGRLLAPHARFYIEKKKSKCTIKFDPPVSGRFILLKMWSSSHDSGSNIDVQSVITRGFAGPRYFPSVELR
ncbi:hypothetical protein HDV57DRAFT_344600 [Trichoderma longibrachiatum]